MFRSRKNKEEHRYYLLPGMGRSNRRRHVQILKWSLVIGFIFSVIFGCLLYFANRR
jgi:hypothetical protein